MNLLKKTIILILFIIPISSIIYKNYIAEIDLIPESATNKWNLSINYPFSKIEDKLGVSYFDDKKEIKLPFFTTTRYQSVDNLSYLDGTKPNFVNTNDGNLLKLSKEFLDKNEKLVALVNVELSEALSETPLKSPRLKEEGYDYIQKLLSLDKLTDEEREQMELLNAKINIIDDDKAEVAKKIYFFITEEITRDENIKTITEALSLSAGSNLMKAQIFTYLNRLNGIPTRINVAYELNRVGQVTKLNPIYMPEILLGDNWFLLARDLSPFDKNVQDFFVLYKNFEDFPKLFKQEFITVRAASVMVNKVDSTLYKKKLKSVSSILSLLSLHNLPVNVRTVFYTVLLIPLGTLVLSISRVILGLKSFGIFTPILLSLFFLETSLTVGIVFFSVIVLLGFGQRYLLDRLYLLAIPRLSILLTLVIISYTFFSLVIYENNGVFQVGQSINYLPIVIITGFIERFSIHFIEEGTVNTIKALLGTLSIAILCYIIFKLNFLKQILFNNPELLLVIIALNLMIGSYKGYRLNEVLRFREFEGINENV
ncbi:MAG: hypothetical protein CME63_16340 [Halobacteriovoraceae bacterium]|nr:hypothetical protein [Halobacteriovoraceae bacterium]|tara:strand:+ start:40279 stop:41898 length:1620 start_codon:yes stop_codon:yes gene_type:complete